MTVGRGISDGAHAVLTPLRRVNHHMRGVLGLALEGATEWWTPSGTSTALTLRRAEREWLLYRLPPNPS